METTGRSRVTPRLVVGAFILLLGVVFLLENLGVLDAGGILRYWPVAVIAFGLASMAPSRDTPGRAWGALIATAGVVLLLNELDVWDVDVWDYWPLLLVLLGGSIMWRALGRGRVRTESGDPSSLIQGTAILGGFERASNAQDFRGGDLTAILGGCEVDLRHASIPEGGEAVIDTFALWGGIEIRVPEDWSVVSRGTGILGAFEDETRPSATATQKKLVVDGLAIMGGVNVKN